MNPEYIKIKCTIKERLLFLFTGIIKKSKLINNMQDKSQNVSDINHFDKMDNKEIVDSIPDKLDIPFFELDNTNVQSNLNE